MCFCLILLGVESHINFDNCRLCRDVTVELTATAKKMDKKIAKIHRIHEDLCGRLKLSGSGTVKLQCGSVLNHYTGWFMHVSLQNETAIRKLKEAHIMQTKNSGVDFHVPPLKEANDEYAALNAQYHLEERGQLDEVLRVACSYANAFRQLNDLLAPLDAQLSLAHVAVNAPFPWTRPTILDADDDDASTRSRRIRLVECRHPLLVTSNVIPNTVEMYHDDASGLPRFHIITGASRLCRPHCFLNYRNYHFYAANCKSYQ